MHKLLRSPAGKGAASVLALVAGVHLLSAVFVDTRLEYREIDYRSDKLSPRLEGYTIAFLTDIHLFPEKKLLRMVDKINERGVDLVLLGGDFSGQKDLARTMKHLSQIKTPDGAYGVEGNHDNRRVLRQAMEGAGMTLLTNEGVLLRDNLYLAGVEDLRTGKPDLNAALSGAREEDLVLLLTHNPDVTMMPGIGGADLCLAGHTHGGIITFFGLWSPNMYVVSGYGHRFQSGWCRSAADNPVFVSRGVGARHPLLPRVFARPQVIYLTLRTDNG